MGGGEGGGILMIRWLAPGILNRTVNPYIFTFVNFFTLVYIATACEDLVKFELYICCACVRPLNSRRSSAPLAHKRKPGYRSHKKVVGQSV